LEVDGQGGNGDPLAKRRGRGQCANNDTALASNGRTSANLSIATLAANRCNQSKITISLFKLVLIVRRRCCRMGHNRMIYNNDGNNNIDVEWSQTAPSTAPMASTNSKNKEDTTIYIIRYGEED
jgi:hypothetical protein